MATKTITLEIDAYEKLKRAKRRPRESFSSVVRRARFDEEPRSGDELLEALRALRAQHPESFLSEEALDLVRSRSTRRRARPRPRPSD